MWEETIFSRNGGSGVIEVDALEPCPRCGGAPEFIVCVLPTGTHVSCKFRCPNTKGGFCGPGVAQRLDFPGSYDLHQEWGRANVAKEWNLCVATVSP